MASCQSDSTCFFFVLTKNLYFSLQEFVNRMDAVKATQGALLEEVKKEGAKFGDDVKYLAEFTAGIKKFDPWIQKADAKRAVGMLKPKNLQEALDQMSDAKVRIAKKKPDSVQEIWYPQINEYVFE